MSTVPASQHGPPSATVPTPHSDHLINFCRNSGFCTPTWQVVSDRRGGRTAWSYIVTVQGQHIPAQFFYDGTRMERAKEDAAQVALQRYGQLAPRGVPPAHVQQHPPQQQAPRQQQQQHQQQQQPQRQQPPPQPSQSQQRYYGVIGS